MRLLIEHASLGMFRAYLLEPVTAQNSLPGCGEPSFWQKIQFSEKNEKIILFPGKVSSIFDDVKYSAKLLFFFL